MFTRGPEEKNERKREERCEACGRVRCACVLPSVCVREKEREEADCRLTVKKKKVKPGR